MALLQRRKKHHRRGKTRISKKNVLERFVTSYLFKLSGIIVVLIGVFYALNSLDILSWLKEVIVRLFQTTDELQIMPENTTGSVATIVGYFLPGILILILSGSFAKRFGLVTYLFSLLSVVYFAFLQTKIIYNFNFGGAVYPTIVIADIFLVFSMIGPLINAFLFKRPFILMLASAYLYLSLMVFVMIFGLMLNYLLPLSIIFTLILAWLAGIIKNPTVILFNFLLTIGFFGFFWLRKLAVNSQEGYLSAFFLYGALLYILFYSIGLFFSNSKDRPMPKWMLLTISIANLLFYVGTTCHVIIKYYSSGYLSIFAITLLFFNLAGLYLSGRETSEAWKVPHHMITLVIASLILPLLLNQSLILLFTGVLSILLLLYLKYSKNQNFIIVSISAMGIMTIDLYFQWVFKYFPAMAIYTALPSASLVLNGILNGVAVMVALTLNYWFLKNIKVSLPKNLFNKTRYIHLIKGLLLFTLFLTTGWIIASFICNISRSAHLVAPGWFISGSIFFIVLILFKSHTFASYEKPILFLAAAFILSFSPLVQLSMTESLNTLMLNGIFSFETALVHYLAIGLGTFLTILVLVHILRLYPSNKIMKRGLQLFALIVMFFTLFSEYDNLSILLKSGQDTSLSTLHFGKEILDYNHRLPFSIILLLSSLVILVWALFKHQHFLRNISILLFSFTIVKIFLYDFSLIGNTARTILFFLIGFLLIGVSFLYPRLKKAASGTRNPNRHHHLRRSKIKLAEAGDEK